MTEVEKGSEVKDRPQANNITISGCIYILLTLWLALLIVDRLTMSAAVSALLRSGLGQGILVVAAAVLGAVAWKIRDRIYRILTAKPFAIAMLGWVLAMTILGTLIIQNGSREELSQVYGQGLAGLIYYSGFNDIFHSLWFGGFLVLLAISLILVLIKRKSWRFLEWGNLLAHAGIVVILIGAFIGYFFGFKGMMDLHVGESSNSAVATASGMDTEEVRPLNFTILLEDFSVERYNQEYRIFLYERSGEGFAVKTGFGLEEAKDWVPVEPGGAQFRLIAAYPDFYFAHELKETAAGTGKPALELELGQGPAKHGEVLFAGVPERESAELGEGYPARFVWEPLSPEELEALSQTRPVEQLITFEKKDCCPKQELEVKVGGEYPLGHGGMYKLKVLQYLPDFVYDTQARKAATRSEEPNNPALQVSLMETATGESEERWLFSKVPEFGRIHGQGGAGVELSYEYRPEQAPPAKELLIFGKTREALELEQGKVAKRYPLPPDGQAVPATGISSFKILAAAEEIQKPSTRSEQWKNPVAEIEIQQGATVEKQFLSSGHEQPLYLPGEQYALALAPKSDEVKAYRSKLAVLEGDQKVLEKTIRVNDPLHYGGYSFYQSNFKKEDPTYSGISVVRDPGLVVVWIGFVMISIGMIFIYYVKPALLQRRKDLHDN